MRSHAKIKSSTAVPPAKQKSWVGMKSKKAPGNSNSGHAISKNGVYELFGKIQKDKKISGDKNSEGLLQNGSSNGNTIHETDGQISLQLI